MCGIIGYTGGQAAVPRLIDSLGRLAYRGYDAAGVAVSQKNHITLLKTSGKLDRLRMMLAQTPIPGTCGIGHTRWATHGAPTERNAHPHMADGIAIVHNGIIDNYRELRMELMAQGTVFVSETDTEVAAWLIAQAYAGMGDMHTALRLAMGRMKGSYAIAIIVRDEPDVLYAIRQDSPLIVATASDGSYLASDMQALLPYTREMIPLMDGDIARLTPQGIAIWDETDQSVIRGPLPILWQQEDSEKHGYVHFMRKEIAEQPAAWARTMARFALPTTMPLSPRRVVLTGCGSAYHAAVAGRHWLSLLSALPAEVEIASELRDRPFAFEEGDLVIVVSQSGETADSLAALRKAREIGAFTLAIVNVEGSSIAREADAVCLTDAGPELAVATTKGYTTQLLLLLRLAIAVGQARGILDDELCQLLMGALHALPEQAQAVLGAFESAIPAFAAQHASHRDAFFIGRSLDYGLSMEGALKLKEIAYIHAEAYPAGELKHGALALIERGTLVVACVTQPALIDKMVANLSEVQTRGAETLVIAPAAYATRMRDVADTCWLLPDTTHLTSPLLAALPLQLFAYAMAVSRGCDVDQPRNLAKSVTVQ